MKKRLSKKRVQEIANERRHQEEQLISLDESVGDIVQSLKDKGILDDTYIIFASDNGVFRGEHRIASGKFLPYDPASRVPLIIRGPGIPAGGVSNELVWNGDIPQTILQIASGSQNAFADGRSLLPYADDPTLRSTRPILLEGDTGPGETGTEAAQSSSNRVREARVHLAGKRGVSNLEQEPDAIKSADQTNHAPAYRSIRTDRYEYTVYANGQTELYDMKRDPAQLNSLAANPRYRFVRKWLYDALIPLSACAGSSCRVELGPDPAPLPNEHAAAEGEEEGPGNGAAARGEEASAQDVAVPALGLRFPAQGHWPNWLRHRPPKSAIPGSSPGCPALGPRVTRSVRRGASIPRGGWRRGVPGSASPSRCSRRRRARSTAGPCGRPRIPRER